MQQNAKNTDWGKLYQAGIFKKLGLLEALKLAKVF